MADRFPCTDGLEIQRLTRWSEGDLSPLVDACLQEGWRHLERLAEEWRGGAMRFDGLGEGLFVARGDAAVLAIAGVVADPYARKAEVGRLRGMYVLPTARRCGVGAELVRHALASAKPVFRELRSRTTDAGASAFYEALGFERVGHLDGASHRIVLAR